VDNKEKTLDNNVGMRLSAHERKAFFYLLLAGVVYVAFLVLKPYLSLAIIAFVTAVSFKPVYSGLFKFFPKSLKKGQRRVMATIGSIIVVLLAVLLPLIFLVNVVIRQVVEFNKDLAKLADNGQAIDFDFALEKTNKLITTVVGKPYTLSRVEARAEIEKVAKPAGEYLVNQVVRAGRGTPEFLTRIVIFVMLLFYFFPLQAKYLKLVRNLSPLDDRLDALYLRRVLAMAESMVKGTLVIAVIQGVVAGLLLAIAGVKYVTFWTLIMIFAGIIPLGAGAIAVPIGIVLLLLGQMWQGLVVILGAILVVSNIDNVLRPKLVDKGARLNPAFLLLGVFGGIKMWGFAGVIYGPVVMILLMTTVDIYLHKSK